MALRRAAQPACLLQAGCSACLRVQHSAEAAGFSRACACTLAAADAQLSPRCVRSRWHCPAAAVWNWQLARQLGRDSSSMRGIHLLAQPAAGSAAGGGRGGVRNLRPGTAQRSRYPACVAPEEQAGLTRMQRADQSPGCGGSAPSSYDILSCLLHDPVQQCPSSWTRSVAECLWQQQASAIILTLS